MWKAEGKIEANSLFIQEEMTWKELDVNRFNQITAKVVVDVRSPIEFEKECIPGAINVPLLSDSERETIGIVYKQEGEFKARKLALKVVAPKIPDIVNRIIELKRDNHTLVVHCWRGGMRSEAVVSFLSLMGVDCWRLSGGYKAWRRTLLDKFEKDDYLFKTVVLDGLTGVGKTEVLSELERLGMAVLDLEKLANHRGSVFGGLGLCEQPSQKNFDASIWRELASKDGDLFLFMEAESKKLGKLSLPDFLYNRIQNGKKVLLTSALEDRVIRIQKEYKLHEHVDELLKVLNSATTFKVRLSKEKVAQLSDYLSHGECEKFISVMLRDYYDPLYSRHIDRFNPQLTVCSKDPDEAVRVISNWLLSTSAGKEGPVDSPAPSPRPS